MSREAGELQTLFEIGKSIAAELDRDKVLRLVAEAAISLVKADESYLLLRRDLDDTLIRCASANIEPEEAWQRLEQVAELVAWQVVVRGQPIRLAQEDGSATELGLKLPVFALLNVPVRRQHKVIGVLGVTHRRAERFTLEAEQLLTGLADYTAIAIENARLYEETKELSRNLKLVNDVSRLVTSTFDVQEIPRLLLQRTAEIVGAECGSLALLDKRRGGVVF
ncbi:MAG TPA: GAF domain-containing protein, partial [Anaerolineae bacterium]|nr:GAF domain-containing protein [Anaerolineae bacterium]